MVSLCGSLQEKSPGPEKSSGIILEDFESQFHLCPNASQTFLRARPTMTDPGTVDDLADLSNPMANLMDVCANGEFFVIARKGLIQLSAKPS